jgi:diguanylate cyclase (GGDEF)-like protein
MMLGEGRVGDGRKPRLLIVDDEPDNVEMLTRLFRSEFEIFHAADGADGLACARKVLPDIVISDQRMPQATGVDLLSKLCLELPDTIRILLTGYTDYAAVVEAINSARIHHYVEKPVQTVGLAAAVKLLLRTHQLEKERQSLVERLQSVGERLEGANRELLARQEQLETEVARRTEQLRAANEELTTTNELLRRLAVRDPLTGMFNYRYLIEFMEMELSRSQRYKRPLSLIFLDVDDFKQINDRFGHSIGDRVLLRISECLEPLNKGVRRSDVAARYGGEEFCIVLPETEISGARLKAERLRAAIETTRWDDLVGAGGRVTVSSGVSCFPTHGSGVEVLLRAADAAQYVAKRRGKNQVAVATSEPEDAKVEP